MPPPRRKQSETSVLILLAKVKICWYNDLMSLEIPSITVGPRIESPVPVEIETREQFYERRLREQAEQNESLRLKSLAEIQQELTQLELDQLAVEVDRERQAADLFMNNFVMAVLGGDVDLKKVPTAELERVIKDLQKVLQQYPDIFNLHNDGNDDAVRSGVHALVYEQVGRADFGLSLEDMGDLLNWFQPPAEPEIDQ